MAFRVALFLLLALLEFGCSRREPATASDEPAPLPAGSVERARVAFYGVGASGRVEAQDLAKYLTASSVICLGEQHDNLTHHALQLQVVEQVQDAAVKQGRPFALGMEMFQLPAQPALNAYAAQTLSEAQMLRHTEYNRRWGFDFEFYRAVMERTRAHGGALLALNAPREWTKTVAQAGLAGLDKRELSGLPGSMNLQDPEHQAFFFEAMAGHGHGQAALRSAAQLTTDPFYQAQVLWDETMADQSVTWLSQQPPGAQLVVLAGAGHCHRSAVPRRIQRRMPGLQVTSVRLVEQTQITKQQIPANTAFDLLLVSQAPTF